MKIARTALRMAVGVSVVAVALSACSSGGGSKSTESKSGGSSGGGIFKFGLVTTSTGPFASNAATMVDGAKYAVKLINDAGGIDGNKIDLVTVDLQNDPKNGTTMVPKLVSEDKVFAIIGPVDSAGCDIVCNTGNSLKVPVVSPGASRPGVIDNARPYAVTLGQPDALNSTPVLVKAVKDRGYKTAVIIVDEANATTKAQSDLYQGVFSQSGVQVVKTVTYKTGDSSFASQVTAIAQAKPDVLALAAGPDDAGRIAREIQSQQVKVTLMGTGALQSGGAAYYAAGGDATNGTVAASQFDPTNAEEPAKTLLADAAKAIGKPEVPLNFAYAFDAVNMVAKVIKDKKIKPGDDLAGARTKIQEGMNNLGTYSGMAGKMSFTDKGYGERPKLLAVMTGGKFVIQH